MARRYVKTAILVSLLVAGMPIFFQSPSAHPVPSPCFDFVTGGGWFAPAGAGPERANFGFNAGYKNGPPPPPLQGHLNYIDHNTGMHVKVHSATSYEGYSCSFNGSECADRVFMGPAEIDGVGGYSYTVEVIDAGEPGNAPRGRDRFIISLSNGYHADSGGVGLCSGDVCGIDGGNIQIHKSCSAS